MLINEPRKQDFIVSAPKEWRWIVMGVHVDLGKDQSMKEFRISGEHPRDILLAIIRAQEDEWLSQSDLAMALGRRRMLSDNDVSCLNALTDEGLIEVQQRPHKNSPHIWFYRARPVK